MKRQSETDFEEETKSEHELDDEEDDISWLYEEYEVSSDEEEFDLSGIFLKLGFLFNK